MAGFFLASRLLWRSLLMGVSCRLLLCNSSTLRLVGGICRELKRPRRVASQTVRLTLVFRKVMAPDVKAR
jgi:hypothetical protein